MVGDMSSNGFSEEYLWCFSVPPTSSEVHRFIDLSSTDQYYFDHPHRRQCIALRFSHVLDPTLLIRCLHTAIQRFPKVGSRVVSYDGRHRFLLESEQTKLRLIIVRPEFLANVHEWRRLFYFFSDHLDREHKSVFHAFLMRSHDESHGCVLFAGFEHCLGDAASYAMFIACWSDVYQELIAQFSVNYEIPPGMYLSTTDGDYGDNLDATLSRPEPRRYELPSALLAELKADMRRRSGDPNLSMNDVLMAQVRFVQDRGCSSVICHHNEARSKKTPYIPPCEHASTMGPALDALLAPLAVHLSQVVTGSLFLAAGGMRLRAAPS